MTDISRPKGDSPIFPKNGKNKMFKIRSIFLLLSLLSFGVIMASVVWGETTRLNAETMKAALRTDTIEEDGFIDYVIGKVNKGQLPADLVDSTFQWARKKSTKHRFQYFKYALMVRASYIGIKI
jgi:hypothetical protein